MDWGFGDCRHRRFRATRHDHNLLTPPNARIIHSGTAKRIGLPNKATDFFAAPASSDRL